MVKLIGDQNYLLSGLNLKRNFQGLSGIITDSNFQNKLTFFSHFQLKHKTSFILHSSIAVKAMQKFIEI